MLFCFCVALQFISERGRGEKNKTQTNNFFESVSALSSLVEGVKEEIAFT